MTKNTDVSNAGMEGIEAKAASEAFADRLKDVTLEYTLPEAKARIDDLLRNKDSFVVNGLGGELLEASKFFEKAIESKGMRCRVYTRNRVVAAAATAWAVEGLVGLALIAMHNLFTLNPDYEIGRAIVDHRLYVIYKKK